MVIYKTTNLVNGKIYVGQDSKNNPKYFGSGLLLHKAIKKYGIDNFEKEILEECSHKEELDEREIYWIKFHNSTNKKIGYNISEGGTGGKLTKVEWKKGKTYEEAYGKEKAEELKAHFSKIRKGKKLGFKNITSEEFGKKISKALKGREITDEHKGKISDTLKEYFQTEEGVEARNNLRKLKTGTKQTEKSNKKRSEKLKGKRNHAWDVHPSAKYWYFYDKDNNLIAETLGNRTEKLKELNTYQRKIVIFTDLDECLNYDLPENKHFKVFTKKYYNED